MILLPVDCLNNLFWEYTMFDTMALFECPVVLGYAQLLVYDEDVVYQR